jgi:hypothetical protein
MLIVRSIRLGQMRGGAVTAIGSLLRFVCFLTLTLASPLSFRPFPFVLFLLTVLQRPALTCCV